MTKPINMILVIVAVSLSTLSLADEIYRTVDESGHVIFTDSPPADASKVERLELPPGPSAGSIRATESRNRAIRQSLEAVENQHVRTAEEAVEVAKKGLKKARSTR